LVFTRSVERGGTRAQCFDLLQRETDDLWQPVWRNLSSVELVEAVRELG
jgi:hypothetical protein